MRGDAAKHLLMVARRTLGTHRCEPDTPLADNRSTDLRLVAMRGAAPPSTLSSRHTIYPDSAHGFLFQHHGEFAADVNAFLAEAS